MRYDIMFAVKNHGLRKISVMDFKMARIVTLEYPTEIDSEEVDEELKEVLLKNSKKINSGYFDYTGTHKPK
ncbi:hypothetical protein M3196_00190 [Fictibacillus nanhaiensis]|uniref:hypothetical protein n=1 Tax=Fictibacillus nanhaiensis TaxID=742169 RepID=UPI00204161CC|nr:hypothetical protein [Fictibacillus nanhaiensis]MCM3730088.1 hypothetical protein [Fictibacillus nanhaiensis]